MRVFAVDECSVYVEEHRLQGFHRGLIGPHRSGTAEQTLELALGAFEGAFALRAELLAAAVEIEIQHRLSLRAPRATSKRRTGTVMLGLRAMRRSLEAKV